MSIFHKDLLFLKKYRILSCKESIVYLFSAMNEGGVDNTNFATYSCKQTGIGRQNRQRRGKSDARRSLLAASVRFRSAASYVALVFASARSSDSYSMIFLFGGGISLALALYQASVLWIYAMESKLHNL